MNRKLLGAALAAAVLTTPLDAQEIAATRTLTLDQAIELATRHDPTTIAAEVGVTRARADVLQARGSFLPSLTANSSFTNSSNERFDQASGTLRSELYTNQLQGSYEIFAGGRRLMDNRAANASLESAHAVYRARQFETALFATDAFYAVAAASDLVDVANQRLTRARQQHEFATTRLELGTATTSDALRAEIEVANAELALHEATSSRAQAALQLGRITGLGGVVLAEPEALPETAPALPPVEELLARADVAAPDIVASEALEATAHAQRLASMTSYLPSVRMTGGYDWIAAEFPAGAQSWSMRLFASLPIFNGFQREAAIQRASAAEDLAEAAARDARLATRAEVQSAAQEIELASRRVEISTRTVSLAQEDLRVQEERYRIGNATILDLQTSQVALAEAQINEVRAKQSLGGAVARLEAILGESLRAE